MAESKKEIRNGKYHIIVTHGDKTIIDSAFDSPEKASYEFLYAHYMVLREMIDQTFIKVAYGTENVSPLAQKKDCIYFKRVHDHLYEPNRKSNRTIETFALSVMNHIPMLSSYNMVTPQSQVVVGALWREINIAAATIVRYSARHSDTYLQKTLN